MEQLEWSTCLHMSIGYWRVQVFGDRKYLDAAVDCEEVVWDWGLLRKGYGLYHGVAGNAHTFLQLDHQTRILQQNSEGV